VKKAIIELQTNKINLILIDTKDNVYYNVIDVFTDNLTLGKEISSDGILKPVMIKDLLKVLKMYRRICDRNGITEVFSFSTKFLAQAKNSKSVLEEIYNTCGFSFSILTSEEQLKYVFTGAINSCDVPKGFFFYVGEKESYIVQFNRRNVLNSAILPFGSEEISKIYQDENLSENEKNAKLQEIVGVEIERLDFLKVFDEETQYLAAGNLMLTIGKLARKATRYPLEIENGYILNNETFNSVYGLIDSLGHDKTRKIKGISAESADEILAGAKIAKKIIETMECKEITISSDNILEGYIATVVLPEINNRPLSDMLIYSLENINTFFSTPGSNNLKVYELCINVFKQLKVIHKLPRAYIKPLRIAGFMYDCGKRIDFDNFKRNGFEVILNSKIKGVSQKDLLLAAFACKLQDLDNFNLTDWVKYSNIVSEEDLDAVKKVGVLIELASALDASKSSAVDDLACDILGDSIIIKTIINKDADFEIKESMKVNNNFKKVFTKFVEII
jgi:exopolyphosphatase/guanosine-5'-triphosphate,3'-diphosphate pyrophosphatase